VEEIIKQFLDKPSLDTECRAPGLNRLDTTTPKDFKSKPAKNQPFLNWGGQVLQYNK
jgi:hypothetical protein